MAKILGSVLVMLLAAPALAFGAGTLPLSQTSVSLQVGQNTTVTASNPTGARLYVVSISNSYVVYANVSGNSVTLYGLGNGLAQVGICSYDNYCNTINVSVGEGNVQGAVFFSRNNIAMNVGEVSSVGMEGSSYGYYISSHSNSNAATAYISNNDLVVTAKNVGFDGITVCASVSNSCSVLQVNVTGTVLSFNNSSPVPAYLGNYYSFQMNAVGGSSPYTYSLAYGSLPAGLSLSNSGLIYGTPSNNQEAHFTVRATDNVGRTVISQSYYLKPIGGVQGSLYYNNGTLVNDSGTIYITYKNTKSGFASLPAFIGHGYKLGNVISGSTFGLTNTGYVISTSNVSHPWGSWVKSGSTIYFMHESGLVPISSYEIFLNNGGSISQVVDANTHDLGRPVLPLMSLNDPRLK